jgi:hypothetical protein
MDAQGGKYRDTKEFRLVYSKLIEVARSRGLTTYQHVAKIMQLPLTGNLMGKETGQMLGEISREEVRCGRPMLTAVVVGTSGYPGDGFYGLAHDLGKIPSPTQNVTFWEAERQRVYDTWAEPL